MQETTSRVAIVTGGIYGIGQAVTLRLATDGWRVTAFGLNARQIGSASENGVDRTRELLAERGLEAHLMDADVTDTAVVEAVVAETVDRFGGVDALVNNAAIHPRGDVVTTDEPIWDQIMAVNLKGPYLCAKAAIPRMRERGGGVIVNIGSGAAWGKPGLAAYGASKGGLFSLTMGMAKDHMADRIRVNMVVPGGTLTGMVEADRVPNFDKLASATASGKINQPADIAAAVAFLLSEDAGQISGTVIDVGCFWHQGSMPA